MLPMPDDSVLSAASDLLHAIETKNTKLIAIALRAAFEILDNEPHEEGPHLSPDQEP